MKALKIKLSPTPAQERSLCKMLAEHCWLYNHCLEKKIEAWREKKENLAIFDLIKSEIPKLRGRSDTISNHSALQQTLRRLDKAYASFFKKNTGFPRFKNIDRFRTIQYAKYADGCKIKNGKLYLQNIGNVKCINLQTPERIKTMSVTKSGGSFYANLVYEYDGDTGVSKTDKSVGLDFGLKNFITTSDGDVFHSPKPLKRSLKEQAKLHRRIHRAEKGTHLRKKHKLSLSKCHLKIVNRRKDFNHKLSRQIINKYDTIVIEDIKLKSLQTEIPNINRTYSDVAFGQLCQFLTYKAENAGRVLIKVDPAYTTQLCSSCGVIAEKALSDRVHSCPCGYAADRDINAAINILRLGLQSLQRSDSGRNAARSSRVISGEWS